MQRKNLLVIVTAINWLLTFICAYVLFTTPFLFGTYIPAEMVVEPIFTNYRQIGRLMLVFTLVLLISAILSTRVLIGNRRGKSVPMTEKAKRTTSNSLEDSYLIVDDEDMQAAQVKQKRSRSR